MFPPRDRVAVPLRVIEELVIGLDLRARQLFVADIRPQRRCVEDLAHKAQSADARAAIGFFGQIARIDDRRVLGAR